jgi:hypothetical protein
MSYRSTSGIDEVLQRIGSAASQVTGVITQYEQTKAALTAPPPSMPVSEPFNWTPVLIIGGLGLGAFLLLRKKK